MVLRSKDGAEIRVSLNTLSEKDRRYAILQAPPRVAIEVSIDTDRDNKGGDGLRGGGVQIQTESIQAEVTIKKTRPAPYEAPLNGELYLMGSPEHQEVYVVLSRTAATFQFSAENKYAHTFSAKPVNLRQLEASRQTGVEYKGYLAVVTDRTGAILELKGSKRDFRENAEAIMGSECGTVFDEAFAEVETGKKKKPAAKKFPAIKKQFPAARTDWVNISQPASTASSRPAIFRRRCEAAGISPVSQAGSKAGAGIEAPDSAFCPQIILPRLAGASIFGASISVLSIKF